MNKKKILFVIYTGSESGGHHYTTLTYAKYLQSLGYDVKILNLGYVKSTAISSVTFSSYYNINILNLLLYLYRIRKFTNKFDIIHCMDSPSYKIVSTACMFSKRQFVYTVCGGQIDANLPYCKNMIFFSEKHFQYYAKKFKKYDNNHILMPNRVLSDEIFDGLQKKEFPYLSENEVKVLIIARLVPDKKEQFLCGKNLCNFLDLHNIKNRLYVVGNINGRVAEKFFMELKTILPTETVFLTETEYVKKASNSLLFCDVAVVTGRGVMEAAGARKIVIMPDIRGGFVLLNKRTFKFAFMDNFSVRCKYPDYESDITSKEILKLLSSKEEMDSYKMEIFDIYHKYFDISSKEDVFNKLYQQGEKVHITRIFLCPVIKIFIKNLLRNLFLKKANVNI